jgi:hypothetical protein
MAITVADRFDLVWPRLRPMSLPNRKAGFELTCPWQKSLKTAQLNKENTGWIRLAMGAFVPI